MKRKPLLTIEQVMSFKKYTKYGLFAEPGAGKTYAFKTVIVPYAKKYKKKVLYLAHRRSLKTQTYNDIKMDIEELKKEFANEIANSGNITIATYQLLEYLSKSGRYEELLEILDVDLIVCDEFHYMITDSWNEQTGETFDYLSEVQCPVVLLTGTPRALAVIHSVWNVEMLCKPDKSKNNLKSVTVYDFSDREIVEKYVADTHRPDHKIINFYTGSLEALLTLKEKYGGDLVCSREQDNFDDIASTKLIDLVERGNIDAFGQKIKNVILPAELIWSTSVWNEGINITDLAVKTIVSWFPRKVDDILQQSARARESKIDLIIVKPAQDVLKRDLKKYKEELKQKNLHIVRKSFLNYMISEIEAIFREGYEKFYQQYVENVEVKHYKVERLQEELPEYLESLVGKRIFADEKKDFYHELFLKGLRRSQNRKVTSHSSINEIMGEMGLPYKLLSRKDGLRNSETYGKMYLILTKVETNIGNTLYSVPPTLVSDKDDSKKKHVEISFKELDKFHKQLEEEEFKNNSDQYESYLSHEQKNYGFGSSSSYDDEKPGYSDECNVRSDVFVHTVKSNSILEKVLALTEDDIEEGQFGGCRVLDEKVEEVETPFGIQKKIFLAVEPVKEKVPLWLARKRLMYKEMKKNQRPKGELIDMESLLSK